MQRIRSVTSLDVSAVAGHHAMPAALLSNSAVKGHDSQAYRNMEMTRERISFTFVARDISLSPQIGFNLIRASVAYAILDRTSGLEPSSETTTPRY